MTEPALLRLAAGHVASQCPARGTVAADDANQAEHSFGAIKYQIFGNARLLVRGLKVAKAELSFAVMAYNFKRVRNMKGCDWMMSALRA